MGGSLTRNLDLSTARDQQRPIESKISHWRSVRWKCPFRNPVREEFSLSTVLLFHDRLATSVLLFMIAIGLWGLFTFAKGGVLEGSISGALVIGQILILVQGAFGLALYVDGPRPSDSVHILYGITAAIAMPFVYTYAKDRDPRQALLMFSLIALFVAGLAIRGMTTGS